MSSDGKSFDRLDGVIWYDGKMLPWEDANVHVLTHGLHYGSCVFEGERSYSGEIFKLREHTERLLSRPMHWGLRCPTMCMTLMKHVSKFVRLMV